MQFRRLARPRVSINVAPLVDVVFLLVIFFAVSTTFLESAGMKLDLPTSTSTAERAPEELVVALSADGRTSFEGQVVELAALGGRLRAALERSERKLVVLRADSDARHGDVVRVMDVIRDAGADSLTVAARPSSE